MKYFLIMKGSLEDLSFETNKRGIRIAAVRASSKLVDEIRVECETDLHTLNSWFSESPIERNGSLKFFKSI